MLNGVGLAQGEFLERGEILLPRFDGRAYAAVPGRITTFHQFGKATIGANCSRTNHIGPKTSVKNRQIRGSLENCCASASDPKIKLRRIWLLRTHSSPKRPHEQQRSGQNGKSTISASKRADLNGVFRADVVSTRSKNHPTKIKRSRLDYSSFYGKTGIGEPLLCAGG